MNQSNEPSKEAVLILTLTAKERQVFDLLFQGMIVDDIAQQIGITHAGASYFVKKIYKKLNVRSRPELLLRFYDFRKTDKNTCGHC